MTAAFSAPAPPGPNAGAASDAGPSEDGTASHDVVHELGRHARPPRLETFSRLRWLAVSGQASAVVVVHFGLGFPLPLGWCLLVIAASAWLNVALRLRHPVSHRLSDNSAFGLLAFDIAQLSALLALTGGILNPFAMLFHAPVLISATALPPRHTVALGLFAMACATLITVLHLPLPWMPGHDFELPKLYWIGLWVALLAGIAFTSMYAWRVAEEGREFAQALAATELVLAREQHLSQLDGLAAAAAHELGTPLATIALVVKELDHALPEGASEPRMTLPQLRADVMLLREQADRCRAILGKLSSLGRDGGDPYATLHLGQLVEEMVDPLRSYGREIAVELGGDGREPVSPRNPGLIHALGNLVENAVDFARSRVEVKARWSAERVEITVSDDGPGFASEILSRLGEPYLRGRGADANARQVKSEDGAGLGLGLFIAKRLIERSGASLRFGNRANGGAVATITWPRTVFERGAARMSGSAP